MSNNNSILVSQWDIISANSAVVIEQKMTRDEYKIHKQNKNDKFQQVLLAMREKATELKSDRYTVIFDPIENPGEEELKLSLNSVVDDWKSIDQQALRCYIQTGLKPQELDQSRYIQMREIAKKRMDQTVKEITPLLNQLLQQADNNKQLLTYLETNMNLNYETMVPILWLDEKMIELKVRISLMDDVRFKLERVAALPGSTEETMWIKVIMHVNGFIKTIAELLKYRGGAAPLPTPL